MPEFFLRDFSVSIGNRLIRARTDQNNDRVYPTLRVVFDIKKSLKPEPNKASVAIYNLSDDNRSAIQEAGAQCILEAGYTDFKQQIFKGDLSFVTNSKQGADWITTFQSGDGQRAYRSSRINESFPPGAKLEQVMSRIAECMKVDIGNAKEKFKEEGFRKGITEFARGVALNGRCSDELRKMTNTAGLEFSIQDNEIQILKPNDVTREQVIVLNAGTGLDGRPELGEKGILKGRSRLIGGIRPGRRIRIESGEFNGDFKVLSVNHRGDSWGQAWNTDFEAKPL